MDAVAMSSAPAPGQVCELERRVLDRAMTPGVRPAAVPADAWRGSPPAPSTSSARSAPRWRTSSLRVGAGGPAAGGARPRSARAGPVARARRRRPRRRRAVQAPLARARRRGEAPKSSRAARGRRRRGRRSSSSSSAALRAASLVVSAALPEVADAATADARAVLVSQARGIQAELAKRLKDADGLTPSARSAQGPRARSSSAARSPRC